MTEFEETAVKKTPGSSRAAFSRMASSLALVEEEMDGEGIVELKEKEEGGGSWSVQREKRKRTDVGALAELSDLSVAFQLFLRLRDGRW